MRPFLMNKGSGYSMITDFVLFLAGGISKRMITLWNMPGFNPVSIYLKIIFQWMAITAFLDSVWFPWNFTSSNICKGQGAIFASILATKYKPKFVIMISGRAPRCYRFSADFNSQIINIPSLHVYGLADDVVSPESSVQLMHKFGSDPKSLVHEGGHVVPLDKANREILTSYIKSFIT